MAALQDTSSRDDIMNDYNDYTAKSRNYKMGVAQGNVIFDPSSQLPREILLETTLKAFGFNLDIWEVRNTQDLNVFIALFHT